MPRLPLMDSDAEVAPVTKRISPYNPSFQEYMERRGIYTWNPDIYPTNLEEIQTALRQRRESLSSAKFSKADYESFLHANMNATTEAGIMNAAFRIIIGQGNISNGLNVPFVNMVGMVDEILTVPRPDLYEGCLRTEISSDICSRLDSHIVPSRVAQNPVLPNFFAELKGPGGNAGIGTLQACHDAAIGARAMQSLRAYVDEDTAVNGKAYCLSAVFCGGIGTGFLSISATHVTMSEDPAVQHHYHMTQIGSYALTNSEESFREGVTAFRNAREWAHEQRMALVVAANAKASSAGEAQSSPTSQSDDNNGVLKGAIRLGLQALSFIH